MDSISRIRIPVLGIAGGSGSGKTTLAKGIAEALPRRCALLELDAYYCDQSHRPARERGHVNFDHPDALEIDLLCRHLEQLAEGRAVETPVYDFHTHTRIGQKTIEPRELLLLEGTMILGLPTIRQRVDLGFYLDVPDDIRLLRRIRRDLTERGRSLDFVEEQYLKHVRPMHERYIAPSRSVADVVLDGCRPIPDLVGTVWKELQSFWKKK